MNDKHKQSGFGVIELSMVIVAVMIFILVGLLFFKVLSDQKATGESTKDLPKDTGLNMEKIERLYAGQNPDMDTSKTKFGVPSMNGSPTVGYDTATVSITEKDGSKSTLYLYRIPNRSWHVFKISEDEKSFRCLDYRTSDLKKAYRGTECHRDDGSKSRVTVLTT